MRNAERPHLTIIGGPSIDTIHLAAGAERVAGGAGLYTALAARRAGVEVTMIGPRPAPIPPEVTRAADLLEWRGPGVEPDGLPRFEISYDHEGRRKLDIVNRGSEVALSPDRVLRELPEEGPVCVIPLTDSRLQLEFVERLKARGRWVACGTYPCGARDAKEFVRAVFETADAFFCNEEEAEILFGSIEMAVTAPGRLLFVTRGSRGVRVVQGTHVTEIAAVAADEVDPTGAGDALCGVVLAALARGEHPVQAARLGAVVAAQVVGAVGPGSLLSDAPIPKCPTDPRVELDGERISIVASWLAGSPQVVGFDFCGPVFPEPGQEYALDFFFAQTLQQFGFWTVENDRYKEPMIAIVGGESRKGSDYLWFVYRRLLTEDPEALTPVRHRHLEREDLDHWYRSDDGLNPVPVPDLHLRLARRYGQDMTSLGVGPQDLVSEANASDRPMKTLLESLDHVGGYKEDPLRKKSALLALVLRQRPEGFLRVAPEEALPPIVDYHIQRSCLRMGLVRISDADLGGQLARRQLLDGNDEAAVRNACYRAVRSVQEKSGRSMAAVDWFFFQNRRRCPEMTDPDCSKCEVESVCARNKELFQPVFRTTFY
jgi:sugar/nucleoside kinase (ribokinase family)